MIVFILTCYIVGVVFGGPFIYCFYLGKKDRARVRRTEEP